MMKNGKGRLVLLVEDDALLQEALGEILQGAGYEVLSALNGAQGFQLLRHAAMLPNLIVSDIVMEPMNGYQFLAAVRAVKKWHNIPFIFLSGKEKPTLAGTELSKTEADNYLIKPFAPADFLAVVEKALSTALSG